MVNDAFIQLNSRKESKTVVARATEYIKSHFREDLTLEVVSAAVFVTPSYLSSLFKQALGVNFIDYIHQFRIDRAKRLFAATGLSVGDIGEQVGYVNAKYFTQVFKKYTGVPPSVYREQAGSSKEERG
jgi:two-component system response regulator YesN